MSYESPEQIDRHSIALIPAKVREHDRRCLFRLRFGEVFCCHVGTFDREYLFSAPANRRPGKCAAA